MFIEPPPIDEKKMYALLLKLQERLIQDDLHATTTWDPGNIPANGHEHIQVTVPGAELGDYVLASFSLDLTDDLEMSGFISAANTAEVHLTNHGVGFTNLAEGTLSVRVLRRTI